MAWLSHLSRRLGTTARTAAGGLRALHLNPSTARRGNQVPQGMVWHSPAIGGKGRLPLKGAALLIHLSWPPFLCLSPSFASDLDIPWQWGKSIQQADPADNFWGKGGQKPLSAAAHSQWLRWNSQTPAQRAIHKRQQPRELVTSGHQRETSQNGKL